MNAWKRVAAATSMVFALGLASPVQAQTSPVVTDLIKDVDDVQKKLVALAKAMPETKYGWRPAPGVRSVGEVFLHVASDNYFIPTGFGATVPASTGIKPTDYKTVEAYEKRSLTKAQIAAELEQSFGFLKAAMAKTTAADMGKSLTMFGQTSSQQSMWIGGTTHLHEHLGQAIAYARSNGVTPPWSK